MSVTKNFKKLGVLALLSIGVLTIQSCSKDPGPAPEYAFLNITNTHPTPATFNIYIDQKRINDGAVAFGGNSGYMPLTPGSHNVKFTTASSTTAFIEKNVALEANSVTSLFLINQGANMDLFTVKDKLGDVYSTKAHIRFINLSPDAPALDLGEKDGEVIISDKAYKVASDFIEVEAKAYVLQIKDKATGAPINGGALESFDFKAGRSYTIIAMGLLEPTDVEQAFASKILIN